MKYQLFWQSKKDASEVVFKEEFEAETTGQYRVALEEAMYRNHPPEGHAFIVCKEGVDEEHMLKPTKVRWLDEASEVTEEAYNKLGEQKEEEE